MWIFSKIFFFSKNNYDYILSWRYLKYEYENTQQKLILLAFQKIHFSYIKAYSFFPRILLKFRFHSILKDMDSLYAKKQHTKKKKKNKEKKPKENKSKNKERGYYIRKHNHCQRAKWFESNHG